MRSSGNVPTGCTDPEANPTLPRNICTISVCWLIQVLSARIFFFFCQTIREDLHILQKAPNTLNTISFKSRTKMLYIPFSVFISQLLTKLSDRLVTWCFLQLTLFHSARQQTLTKYYYSTQYARHCGLLRWLHLAIVGVTWLVMHTITTTTTTA